MSVSRIWCFAYPQMTVTYTDWARLLLLEWLFGFFWGVGLRYDDEAAHFMVSTVRDKINPVTCAETKLLR